MSVHLESESPFIFNQNDCSFSSEYAQWDSASRAKYAACRARGHSHGRALRTVADRLLYVACAMLRNAALYQPPPDPQPSASAP